MYELQYSIEENLLEYILGLIFYFLYQQAAFEFSCLITMLKLVKPVELNTYTCEISPLTITMGIISQTFYICILYCYLYQSAQMASHMESLS